MSASEEATFLLGQLPAFFKFFATFAIKFSSSRLLQLKFFVFLRLSTVIFATEASFSSRFCRRLNSRARQ